MDSSSQRSRSRSSFGSRGGGSSSNRSPLIKQERAKFDPSSPMYYYTQHALASCAVTVQPSSTGNNPLTPSDRDQQAKDSTPISPGRFLEDLSDENENKEEEEKELTPVSQEMSPVEMVANLRSASDTGSEVPTAKQPSIWPMFCNLVTCFAFPKLLKLGGLANPQQQQAWREKIGLVVGILFVSMFMGLATFTMSDTSCEKTDHLRISHANLPPDSFTIHGHVFNATNVLGRFHSTPEVYRAVVGKDASFLFQNVNNYCRQFIKPRENTPVQVANDGRVPWYFPCRLLTKSGHYARQPNIYETWQIIDNQHVMMPAIDALNHTTQVTDDSYGCHLTSRQLFYKLPPYAEVYYTWEDLHHSYRRLVVFLGDVIDLDRLWLLEAMDWQLEPPLTNLSAAYNYPKDVSILFGGSTRNIHAMKCLVEIAKVGVISTESLGCIAGKIILIVSLIFIFSLIGVKFTFAVYYQWFLSPQMGGPKNCGGDTGKRIFMPGLYDRQTTPHLDVSGLKTAINHAPSSSVFSKIDRVQDHMRQQQYPIEVHPLICLITIYAEEEPALRKSLNALAMLDYPDSYKLIVAVCDGIVAKDDDTSSTPDVVLSVLDLDNDYSEDYSYVSTATRGARRLNQARIYTGRYHCEDHVVPVVLIVKCGDEDERRETTKPGNRGKRDSQLLLMNFLQKVVFDERMTDLENEFYLAVYNVTGFYPDVFEFVLMVDADTQVYTDSLYHMVACFNNDSQIVGLCGETKIENKQESWVSRIQVFEYFISHHLTKAFESVFGGVTCLPGCFCMYRIKVSKGEHGFFLPILANPDVVERYSDYQVDTLHKKNLLLLGEDRYLSTLMLRTFPRRKQVFVARAKCTTTVPTSFGILLDQRRRWINSTIHNLLELLLVRDLCGVFCISMQFVVFIELIGTVTLPAALVFTFYLIIVSILRLRIPLAPLALLISVIGIPGVLIVITGHKPIYLMWMLIYLCSLPIWNFVLPLNAFWKFDEFSWGHTQFVDDTHITVDGKFDPKKICMMSIRQYVVEKYKLESKASSSSLSQSSVYSSNS